MVPVTLLPAETGIEPGKLQVSKSAVLVGTGSHAVQLQQVKPAGRNWMKAADWARGLHAPELRFD